MVRAHEKLFRNSGMDFVMGTARFVGERTVEVAVDDGGTRTIRGRDVVVDTGTTPAMPDTTGLAEVDPWTSESILRLERLPESVIVLPCSAVDPKAVAVGIDPAAPWHHQPSRGRPVMPDDTPIVYYKPGCPHSAALRAQLTLLRI